MIKINLGCGKRDFGKDWVHIDGSDYPHISKEYGKDITLPAFNYDSIDLIYASHLIAYFSKEDFKQLLNYWYRKLKSGGILRLATPDFNIMTKLYQDGKVRLKDIEGPLYGKMMMKDQVIFHKYCYDWQTLFNVLTDSGFVAIKQYHWRDTDHAEFDDQSQAYLNPKGDKENGILISLNVECLKP